MQRNPRLRQWLPRSCLGGNDEAVVRLGKRALMQGTSLGASLGLKTGSSVASARCWLQ